jgi:hypothetical protein
MMRVLPARSLAPVSLFGEMTAEIGCGVYIQNESRKNGEPNLRESMDGVGCFVDGY